MHGRISGFLIFVESVFQTSVEFEPGWNKTTFYETAVPMSTYLVCFIVCDFLFTENTITAPGHTIPVRRLPFSSRNIPYENVFASIRWKGSIHTRGASSLWCLICMKTPVKTHFHNDSTIGSVSCVWFCLVLWITIVGITRQ